MMYATNKFNVFVLLLIIIFIHATKATITFQQFGSSEYGWSNANDGVAGSYQEAEKKCRNFRAALATVKTKEINEFLLDIIISSLKRSEFHKNML